MNGLERMSVVEAVRWHTAVAPDAVPYLFLADGDTDERPLTYRQLDERASALAAEVDTSSAPGARVVILVPPGPDFFVAFLACLYAGRVAVPCYPPDPRRLDVSLERVAAVVADAEATTAITVAEGLAAVDLFAGRAPALKALTWLAVDEVANADASWAVPEPDPRAVAFLQYTSGSTGDPRGVMVSQANLMANFRLIDEGVAQEPGSTSVLWLPPYHDMGLVNVLYALVAGLRCIAMSPAHFAQRPSRWLEAISRYRATYSGAPNFAYDLCTARVSDSVAAGLDLSSWDVAFCGAEPVRAATLERFADRFEASGFHREALYPCYGLAEFTVAVCGDDKHSGVRVDRVDARALRDRSEAVPAVGDDPAMEIVDCGTTKSGHEVAVVDPETRTRVPDGVVGELWCRGPSRALGYWGEAEASEATFDASLADGTGGYLRTGDLGYIRNDRVHVAGRLKDLVIVRGRNHLPHDIERTVMAAHRRVRDGGVVAFADDEDGIDRLVVLAETRLREDAELDEVARTVRVAVARAHDVEPAAVVLVKARSLPLTTSGKIRRRAAKAAWKAGELPVVGGWATASPDYTDIPVTLAPPIDGDGAEATPAEVQAWLVTRVAAVLGMPANAIDPRALLTDLGLDSLQMVELTEDLGVWIGAGLPPTLAWEAPSLAELATAVGLDRVTGTRASDMLGVPLSSRGDIPDDVRNFYVERDSDEDRARTNVHYQIPARFFEVMTGGRWNIYSSNVWQDSPEPVPEDPDQQTASQERKLDVFAELLELEPGMRVLDVGSAYGGALLYLASRYGIEGYGVNLSENQVAFANARAEREGLPCRFQVRHWRELDDWGAYGAVMHDEAIVHFSDLLGFFQRCERLLRDGGVFVSKELHFTHPQFGYDMDLLSSFVNDIFGGTGNYRSLADELSMANEAGFLVEDVRQFDNRHYLLTASSWYANLRANEEELLDLVGPAIFARFLKYVTWVMLGPGGRAAGPKPLQMHFVKCRKPDEAMRRRLGIALEETSTGDDDLQALLDRVEAMDDASVRSALDVSAT